MEAEEKAAELAGKAAGAAAMPWAGAGGGVPPELGKPPDPPGLEMLLLTGEIWKEGGSAQITKGFIKG